MSRAGDNTKIILTGDPYQIDNPYVDAMSNGLVHAVKRFRDTRIAAHVTLSKGERSELAETRNKSPLEVARIGPHERRTLTASHPRFRPA